MTLLVSLFVAVLLLSTGCSKKDESADKTTTQISESIADGSNAIGSAMDEQSGTSFASFSPNNPFNSIVKAYAASCQRAGSLTCDNSTGVGIKAREFSCSFGRRSNRTITGTMKLQYSDSTCSMQTKGNSVTRSFSRTVTLPRGTMIISTDANADFNGISYGGGNILTKTESGHTLRINGRHRRLNNSEGTEILSVSSRSLDDIVISGGLSRSSRTIESGRIEVSHNIAKFTALYEPSGLQFDNTCCHPISGRFSVTYSGSLEGTATVEFSSCGNATLTRNGETTNVSFDDEQCD